MSTSMSWKRPVPSRYSRALTNSAPSTSGSSWGRSVRPRRHIRREPPAKTHSIGTPPPSTRHACGNPTCWQALAAVARLRPTSPGQPSPSTDQQANGGHRPAPTNKPTAAIAQLRPTSPGRSGSSGPGGAPDAPVALVQAAPWTLRSLWSGRCHGRPWFFGGKHRPRVFLLLARGSGWVPRAAVVRPPPVFVVVVGDVVRVHGCGLAGR